MSTAAGSATSVRTRPLLRTVTARALDHPVASTFAAGLVFVVTQLWWIERERRFGSFNVDEAGGLAASFRFARASAAGPHALVTSVFSTWNGPLVPVLTVPAARIWPGSATAVMAVQPLLVVVAACAVAGIVRSVGARGGALAAGVVALGLPVSVASSRSYQYSIGVAAFLAVAMWALLTSDRGRRPVRMLAFGAAVGCMVLCRTLSLSFVPSVAVAALVVIRWERRSVLNVGVAALTSFAVAGPWWLTQLDHILGYLGENAYGDRARYWGVVPIWGRFVSRVGYLLNDFRLLPVIAAPIVVAAALHLVRRMRRRPRRPLTVAQRSTIAVWIVTVGGFAALMSTANVGDYFAHPLDLLLVAGVTLLAVVLPADTFGRFRSWRTWSAAAAVAVTLFSVALSFGVRGSGNYGVAWRQLFVGNHLSLQGGNLEADARLESTVRADRDRASAEWWSANRALASEIDRIQRRDGELVQTVTGEIHLFNSNTIELAEEVTGRGVAALEVINTLEPPDRVLRRSLRPERAGVTRVLVVVSGRSLAFPNGRGRERFVRLARSEGWGEEWVGKLPDGGNVAVFTHPGARRSG